MSELYQPLFDYIERYGKQALTSQEKEILESAWQYKKLRKRQFFLEEGKVCHHTGFILKGAIRQYSVADNGTDHILQLCVENWWVVDRESYINQVPSKYFIEAWEDTELLILPRSGLDVILDLPIIKSMFWQMSENNHIASQKRLDDILNLNAEKRYENFQRLYPEIVQRFPQHQIASYLGITGETLSRIRKKSPH